MDKKYELDLDTSSRNQKKEIEKLELAQNADLRTSSRKMKQDQVSTEHLIRQKFISLHDIFVFL